MEIKLFGKSLFNYRSSKSDQLWGFASSENKTSKYLPDFYTAGGNNGNGIGNEYIQLVTNSSGTEAVAVPKSMLKQKEKKEEVKKEITPKDVYEMETLHDKTFKLNTNPEYVDKQLAAFKDKLGMISNEEYDMRQGVKEISSVVLRLENRKKYATQKDFFEQFPYTTTSKIQEVTKTHTNLKIGQIAQFIADMPKEATDIMKDYNKATEAICSKQAVFYIIADQKDFKSTSSRRDPILLAQSPFGHFWQILGAWDKEMLFLEEL